MMDESDNSERDPQLSSGEEELDDQKHASLIKAMEAMDGKNRPVTQRTEAANMSEYQVSSGRERVKLHELVGALHEKTGHGDLKKQLQRVNKRAKVLNVPLSKPQQERVHRTLAYENVSKEVTKWDPVVHKNRFADQLQFPLERADLRLLTSPKEFIQRVKPTTSLELEVASLLRGSDHALTEDHVLTPAEERALKAMSIQEAKERRAELQKYRALLSYQESKARRQKKIKSKRYHRILQKEKLKEEKKSIDALEKSDPEAYSEKLRKLDANRIQERMSLKHRGGSKFAKKEAIYKKYDGQSRDSIQEMLQKSRQLTKKIAVETDSEDEAVTKESDDDLSIVKETDVDSLKSESNPWMSSGIKLDKKSSRIYSRPKMIINKEAQEDGDSDDGVIEPDFDTSKDVNIDELFDKIKSAQKTKRNKTSTNHATDEMDEDSNQSEDSEIESEVENETKPDKSDKSDEQLVHDNTKTSSIGMSLKRKQTLEDFDDLDGSEDDSDKEVEKSANQITCEASHSQSNHENSQSQVKADPVSVDPKNFITLESATEKPMYASDGDDSDEEKKLGMTIAEAFASDDVVDEFVQEKRDVRDKEKVKDIDLTLPGWGDWGGGGLKPSRKKRKRLVLKAPEGPPRKDWDLSNVIISEVKDRTIAKHQVRELPFPFTKLDQFESSIRQPIGKTWNPETSYRKLIKPKLVTRMGAVIDPMDKEEVFKKQKKSRDTLEKREPKDKKKKHGRKR